MLRTSATAYQFWAQVFMPVRPAWWADADRIIAQAEPRRGRAKFNTGSISQTASVALRAISAWTGESLTAIEVGTFIGVSTKSLHAATVYTCDVSNDCLDSDETIHCFPYQTSTQMFRQLVKADIWAGLFFFDGLLSVEDVDLIDELSMPETVYVFDDYHGEYKGVQNVNKLKAKFPAHVLVTADGWVKDDTTLAVLVPEDRL